MGNSALTSVTQQQKTNACLRATPALGWTLLATVMIGAVGSWPTYALAGLKGLEAMLVAGAIVSGVDCLAICCVLSMAPEGGGKLALAFIAAGMAKVIVCVALGVLAAMLLPLPAKVLLLWLTSFYVVLLLVQIFWLVKKIRQGSR